MKRIRLIAIDTGKVLLALGMCGVLVGVVNAIIGNLSISDFSMKLAIPVALIGILCLLVAVSIKE